MVTGDLCVGVASGDLGAGVSSGGVGSFRWRVGLGIWVPIWILVGQWSFPWMCGWDRVTESGGTVVVRLGGFWGSVGGMRAGWRPLSGCWHGLWLCREI